MRAMPIKVYTGKSGFIQMKAAFKKNWPHYLQEALGLAIFMISACFFGAILFSNYSTVNQFIQSDSIKNILMGVMMGLTALFIFYSPFTAPSGSHINPAVTVTFLRLGKMCRWDAIFFIIFQFIGGTLAVYIMAMLMGNLLRLPPVNYVVTVPGKSGMWPAFFTEFIIAFVMMTMVLFTSSNNKLKKYTKLISGCFVCMYVIFAGPISGFGMNPARTFASAFPSHIYTAFWIYMTVPFAGMLLAAEFFLIIQKLRSSKQNQTIIS